MKGDVTPMGYRENKRSTLSGDKKFFVPMNNRIATVTGFGSIVGSLAEVLIAPFISWLMDTQGNMAYTVLFAILTVLLIIGCFAGLTIAKNNKKAQKTA